ncbi:hypothetical protein [Streptomyces sp. NPDC006193]|uniref:hypothetical protein n=1 Tax=Streptomyces sp. NPDC006193 TaxID=3155717 RepID=UPI0033B9C08F
MYERDGFPIVEERSGGTGRVQGELSFPCMELTIPPLRLGLIGRKAVDPDKSGGGAEREDRDRSVNYRLTRSPMSNSVTVTVREEEQVARGDR